MHGRSLTLQTVMRDDIAQWISTCGTVNRTRAIYAIRLDLLFRWMQDEGHRDDLPTKNLPRAKVPRSVPRPIPTADLHRALELAGARVGLMLTLAAYGGLRVAEISKIVRADILTDRDMPLLLVHGKGNKERLIPLGPVVLAAFARYGLPKHGPVFVGRHGTMSPHTISLLIAGHLRACGVDATAHQGRHWFISTLYEETRDLRLCQEMAGHSSPATTAGYAAWNPTRAAAAVNALPSHPVPDEAA